MTRAAVGSKKRWEARPCVPSERDPSAQMGTTESVSRIAIVNRGEADQRCVRAIREMLMEEGIELAGIALYTDPDRLAPFVREADEALNLGAAFQQSATGEMKSVYLDYDKLVAALRTVRADAVWPGWG